MPPMLAGMSLFRKVLPLKRDVTLYTMNSVGVTELVTQYLSQTQTLLQHTNLFAYIDSRKSIANQPKKLYITYFLNDIGSPTKRQPP